MNRSRFLQAICAVLAVALPAMAKASDAPPFHLKAEYDRPGLSVSHWVFQIDADGSTEYKPTYTSPQPGTSEVSVQRFTMSSAGLRKLQKLLADSKSMQPCETKTKGLARMGMKTMEYVSSNGTVASCSFNYTDNKPLAAAADYLMATSYTLEEGTTINRLHRYDRLGLDPVLIRLFTAAKDGKAKELAAIKPSLEALIADDQVLERVRVKATQLLELARQQ